MSEPVEANPQPQREHGRSAAPHRCTACDMPVECELEVRLGEAVSRAETAEARVAMEHQIRLDTQAALRLADAARRESAGAEAVITKVRERISSRVYVFDVGDDVIRCADVAAVLDGAPQTTDGVQPLNADCPGCEGHGRTRQAVTAPHGARGSTWRS